MRRSLLVAALAAGALGCGAGTPASELAKAPEFNPEGQTKCSVAASQSRPLIVEWPSTERGDLEAQARKGVVAVRYSGCEMQLLRRCTVPATYEYTAFTRKDDQLSIVDADELYANVPIGAAKLEGKLERAGELSVNMTVVGKLEAPAAALSGEGLAGDCEGATHLVTGVTVGAFEFFAGAEAEVGGGVEVMGVGAGAKSNASRELLNRDGSREACAVATTKDEAPPEGCGAFLRLEVTPLAVAKAKPAATPPGSGTAPKPSAKSPQPSMPLAEAQVRRFHRAGRWYTAALKGGRLSLHLGSSWETAGLDTSVLPAFSANRSGRVTLMATDARGDGHVMSLRGDKAGRWTRLPPTRTLVHGFTMLETSKDVIAAFARNEFGRIQHTWQERPGASSWAPWLDLEGQLKSAPLASIDGAGRLHVAGRRADGMLLHRAQTKAYGSWGSWEELGKVAGTPAMLPAGAGLTVLAIVDGKLMQRTRGTGPGWSDWTPVSSKVRQPRFVAAIGEGASSVVVVQDGSGTLHHRLGNGAFAALPKRFASQPTLAAGNGDVVEIAVTDAKGKIWLGALSAGRFAGWTELPR